MLSRFEYQYKRLDKNTVLIPDLNATMPFGINSGMQPKQYADMVKYVTARLCDVDEDPEQTELGDEKLGSVVLNLSQQLIVQLRRHMRKNVVSFDDLRQRLEANDCASDFPGMSPDAWLRNYTQRASHWSEHTLREFVFDPAGHAPYLPLLIEIADILGYKINIQLTPR